MKAIKVGDTVEIVKNVYGQLFDHTIGKRGIVESMTKTRVTVTIGVDAFGEPSLWECKFEEIKLVEEA